MKHDAGFSLYPRSLILVVALIVAGVTPQAKAGTVGQGDTAPVVTLPNLEGGKFDLATFKEVPLSVLYFFSPTSPASSQGMDLLLDLNQRHGAKDVRVAAVAVGTREAALKWAERPAPGITVVLDDGRASRLYGVGDVLPVAYLLGPDLKVLDLVSGGGKGGHKLLLLRLAERELARRDVKVARSLADEAVRQAPEDAEARTVVGYAALKAGKIDEAEGIFREVASTAGPARALGKEGLSYVRLNQGATEEAWALAQEASGRAGADVLKGDILFAKGDPAAALAAYQEAAGKPGFAFQAAGPYDRLGRVAARGRNFAEARKYYDHALRVDPYAVETLSNKGVSFAKEGRWEQAAATYREVINKAPEDQIAQSLLRQAQEMLALAQDAKKSERIDRLIKELSERFQRGGGPTKKADDEWTSRPMGIAFLPLADSGLPGDRDGIAEALSLEIGRQIETGGRIRVVERVLLDKLLGELNLGTSELADPDTALRLGRVLAARLLATGALGHEAKGSYLSLRLIDSETSAVPVVLSNLALPKGLSEAAAGIASEITAGLKRRYPLQGYVVQVLGEEVIINLGSDHGIGPGLRLAVVEEGEAVLYKGRPLKRALSAVGELEVTRVEPGLSYARVVKQPPRLKADVKVREMPEKGGVL